MTINPASIPPDGRHRYAIRVYYEDTDAGGVVYHANYLRYAERARTEALRDLGAVSYTHLLCLVTRNIRDVRHSGARLLNPWDHDPGGWRAASTRRSD